MKGSFRLRLMLWNIAVSAVVIGIFSWVLIVAIQHRMDSQINNELMERGRHPAAPPPGGPGGFGVRRQGGEFGGRMEGGGPPPNIQFGGPMRPRGFLDTSQLAFLRRPRIIEPGGQVIGVQPNDTILDPKPVQEALDGKETLSEVNLGGHHVRLFTGPWRDEEGTHGAIQIGRELDDYDQLWTGQIRSLLMLLPLALLAAGVGGLFLAGRALKPVAQVTMAASEIGEHDLSRRLDVSGTDELAQLSATFNGMIARLEGAFETRREAYERLERAFEQQRRFTADASHELRTPLSRIKVSTSSALSLDDSADEYRKALEVADQAADAMSRLIQQLLVLARADAGELNLERRPVLVHEVVEIALRSMPDTSRVEVSVPSDLQIDADPDQLARVLSNLIENGLRHSPADSTIQVRAVALPGETRIEVEDHGEGIAPEHLPHLTERFYRVDSARARKDGGTGLGLAISKSIIEAHGGTLAISSELGKGTLATVRLP